MNLTQQLIILARDIETESPIDWGMLSIDEDTTYELLASSVIENYLMTDKDQRDMVLLATVVHLVVENFTLNLKLLKKP